MYVNFRDPNKACPHETYSLPQIDQLVDATLGHKMINFMNAYLGYNQIRAHLSNETHMTFYTDSTYYATRSCLLDWSIRG